MNRLYVALLAGLSLAVAPQQTEAQAQSGPTLELYGFAMMDAIADFKQNNPDWFDTMRPTKLPSFENEFGKDGRTWFSARQSRIGVKADVPTGLGKLFTQWEFEFFGVGVDAGQTTIRLRHAFGQLGQFGAGQTNSPFMDGDVFPNTVEYWGPNGMLFFRNVQIFWQPINENGSRFTIALERPGASGDQGVFADRIELSGIEGRFPLPDLSAEYRVGQSWGYVELAGIVRRIHWDDTFDDAIDLSGSTTGWGVSLSSNIKPTPNDVLRLQVVYGEGVENYFNDAPVDIGIETTGNPARPIEGVALPDLGVVAYLDHTWTPKWSSSIGFSMVDIENSDGQAPDAYSLGRYASVNLAHTPVTNVMVVAELQYGDRENFSDGFKSEDYRLQFSFKYNFSRKFGM